MTTVTPTPNTVSVITVMGTAPVTPGKATPFRSDMEAEVPPLTSTTLSPTDTHTVAPILSKLPLWNDRMYASQLSVLYPSGTVGDAATPRKRIGLVVSVG